MYALRNIFSSIIEKAKLDTEKKPIFTQVNGGINRRNRDYTTFDQEVISRTNYLLQNKK